MNAAILQPFCALLRGDRRGIGGALGARRCAAAIAVGFGLYGAAVGAWRAPLQAVYSGIKFPLMVLLALGFTGALSGMLAPLLGARLGFADSLREQLRGFAAAALILGSLAPLAYFISLNAPPPGVPGAARYHSIMLTLHVGLIAYAGIVSQLRLLALLRHECGATAAARVVFAWLAANLLAGSQLSWNLRPFFGSPGLKLQFLRDDPFDGSFFESAFRSASVALGSQIGAVAVAALGTLAVGVTAWALLGGSKPESHPSPNQSPTDHGPES